MQWSTFDRWWLSAWILPIISASMWLGMLAAMFGTWEAQGRPHYPSMDDNQKIAYISDVGAFGLKPLFITGSAVTTAFLDLGFMAERWLRHYGRLAANTSRVQSALSSISIFFAVCGTCGLVFLSIFDTYHHHKVHDGCLFLFLGGYIASAIFLCAEYQRLGIHYRQHRILRMSFWIKLVFIVVEVILAVVFASTSWKHHYNVAAGVEWVIALIFTFYVLSFALDLWPSVRSKKHVPQGWREREAVLEKDAERNGGLPPMNEGPGAITSDPVPNNETYRGTAMTGGQGLPASGHSDLGRQKKRGIGRMRF